MAGSKKKAAGGSGSTAGGATVEPLRQFGVSTEQLVELMSLRTKEERSQALAEYEGVEGLMGHLEVNLKTGLPTEPNELARRRAAFGTNVIPSPPPKSFIALCIDAIQDKTLIILMFAAVLSIILGVTVEHDKSTAWIDGAAILSAVVIVVLVTATNDWTKERQFRGLQKKLESDSKFSVVRGGDTIEVTHADLVVGDIAEFKYGNTFPVDGILVQGNDVKVSEAALTGEAELVRKIVASSPMLFSGTQVMEGRGTMLVTAVGPNSQQGRIFALMRGIEEESGFITEALKKLYAKIFKKAEEEPIDPELAAMGPAGGEQGGEREEKAAEAEIETAVQTEVYEYRPSDPPNKKSSGIIGRIRQYHDKRKEEQQAAANEEEEKEGVSSESVLQKKLNKLAVQIGYGGTVAAIICVLVLTIRFSIEEYAVEGRGWDSSVDFSQILHFVIIGITVLVVAIPEGLPLAVTIALAFSVKKMLKDNNLVRHLHACETMGNATSICSDKTGTLTTNRMTVVESYFAGIHYDVIPRAEDLPSNLLDMLKDCIAINSNYTSLLIEPGKEPNAAAEQELSLKERVVKLLPWKKAGSDQLLGQGLKLQVGNVTECALLGLLEELKIDYAAIREAHPTSSFTKVFTFNSARKSMSTIIPQPSGGYLLLCKGASEIVLKKCDFIVGENGRILPLNAGERKNIINTVVQPMANNALRTLCMAYKEIPASSEDDGADISSQAPDFDNEEEMVAGLTCIGIVGIQDPVRPEVPHCIQQCQEAGIVVRMVTGDNVDTARAIALKCGIISEDGGREKERVMDGKEFNRRIRERGEVNQQMFDRMWPRLRVLARSSPEDKHTLVDHIIRSKLSKNREVVAVTGDGTNDGPALKRADVGFAMGIAGTDVAKEACDIILTDDNFASIVKAVKWGRNVYDSISKFLQFQLTVNIVAVSITIISAFTITDSPLRAIQMLWVNLIMDTLASLALATENPTDDLLKRRPYGRTKALISRHMWLFMFGHSIYQLTVLLVLVFAGAQLFDIETGIGKELRADPTQHFTVVFNAFVFMQLFNEINARKIHGERNVFDKIWTNWIFMVVMVVQTSVQIIIVQFGDVVFDTAPLGWDLWMWCIFLGSLELVVNQILLLIPVNKLPLKKLKFWKSVEEVDTYEQPYDPENTRAQVLWMKSLRRIQTQIRVVNAFRSTLESGHLLHVSMLPTLQETPRPGRYQSNQTIEGRVTSV